MGDSVGQFFTPENPGFPFARIYKSLSPDKKEIRLVEIVPGGNHESVSLNLVHGCFLAEHHTSYEALSYCAGDVNDNRIVKFHGYGFNIFKSLYEALFQLRPGRGQASRMIWLDQLCIHQQDDNEKGDQVMMMKEIYEKASCVLCWLGNPTSDFDSTSPFDLVEDFWSLFGDKIELRARALLPPDASYKKVVTNLLIGLECADDVAQLLGAEASNECGLQIMADCEFFVELKNVKSFSLKVKALSELLRRQYWTRKWILQEIAAAENATLVCGNYRLRAWDLFVTYKFFRLRLEFERANGRIDDMDSHLELLDDVLHAGEMHGFLNFWTYAQISRNFCLLDALYLSRNADATDPRDKMYSLLSTAGRLEATKHGILPVYSVNNPVSAVITMLSELYVASGLDSRGFALSMANGAFSKYDIPSWCFDFTLKSSEQPGRGARSGPVLKVGYSNAVLERDAHTSYLKIQGYFLGVIKKCSSITHLRTADSVDRTRDFVRGESANDRENSLLDWLLASEDMFTTEHLSLLEVVLELLYQIAETGKNMSWLIETIEMIVLEGDYSKGLECCVHLLLLLFDQPDSPYHRWQLATLTRADIGRSENEDDAATLRTEEHASEELSSPHEHQKRQTVSVPGPPRPDEENPIEEKPLLTTTCDQDGEHTLGLVKNSEEEEGKQASEIPTGFLGVVQGLAEAGDEVFREAGGKIILVLRPQRRTVGDINVYKLIGRYEFGMNLIH